jgi:hypothetical protein
MGASGLVFQSAGCRRKLSRQGEDKLVGRQIALAPIRAVAALEHEPLRSAQSIRVQLRNSVSTPGSLRGPSEKPAEDFTGLDTSLQKVPSGLAVTWLARALQ